MVPRGAGFRHNRGNACRDGVTVLVRAGAASPDIAGSSAGGQRVPPTQPSCCRRPSSSVWRSRDDQSICRRWSRLCWLTLDGRRLLWFGVGAGETYALARSSGERWWIKPRSQRRRPASPRAPSAAARQSDRSGDGKGVQSHEPIKRRRVRRDVQHSLVKSCELTKQIDEQEQRKHRPEAPRQRLARADQPSARSWHKAGSLRPTCASLRFRRSEACGRLRHG